MGGPDPDPDSEEKRKDDRTVLSPSLFLSIPKTTIEVIVSQRGTHTNRQEEFVETRQDKTRQAKTRQDKTSQDKTSQDNRKTRQDKPRQAKTRQDKTRQAKTRQAKTAARQDKTRQDKTRHNATQDKLNLLGSQHIVQAIARQQDEVVLLGQAKKKTRAQRKMTNNFFVLFL